MPEKKTIQRARKAKQEGKSPSTQAGEFVRETIEHIRDGKHGARSAEQAIAIGLSKARKAGVKLPAPKKGETSEATRKQAKRDLKRGGENQTKSEKPNPKRARATTRVLKREGTESASKSALSRHAKEAAKQRSPEARSASARKAAKTRKANAR